MGESVDILRSYADLLRRLSGARTVTFYLPPASESERGVLVHEGTSTPLSELADLASAAELDRGFVRQKRGEADSTRCATRLGSRDGDGALFRIPLAWGRPKMPHGPNRRRKADLPSQAASGAWVGLRFDRGAMPATGEDTLPFPVEPRDQTRDEGWWSRLVLLAAMFAAHARTVSRILNDPVTGLPERAEFQAELDLAIACARASGRPMSLIFINPDDFGTINEHFDRQAGDRVLADIAERLRATLRSTDRLARFGGAIISAILVDTSPDDARTVAGKMLGALGTEPYLDGALRLGFSIGVAIADPSAERLPEPDELIRRVDQALSASKRTGGNQIRIWKRGSEVERAGSVDRLQGIFTGNMAKDYRNMRLLWESVAVIAASTNPVDFSRRIAERLCATVRARRAGVFERREDGAFRLLGGIDRTGGTPVAFAAGRRELGLVALASDEDRVVLEDQQERDEEGKFLSSWVSPLRADGTCLGCIYVEGRADAFCFDGSDLRFLDALSSQVAVALDRARLAERERQRQEVEKERLVAELEDLRRVLHGSKLAYRSAAMESVLVTVRKVALTDATVLITGESGSGKEVLARTLHGLSSRRGKPLVVVDCGAISPTLIESELFGHEKGAFTGAHARKAGRLAEADGATVFLDEIGELPLDVQSKLLRFVQEKQFTPVGATKARTVDARIIAATNQDLGAKVAAKQFREDLYHRLNVVRIAVPPLRERKEDILHLADVFLQQFAALYRKPGLRLGPRAQQALQEYHWPGNVRELQNRLIRAVLFSDGHDLNLEDLGRDRSAAAVPEPEPESLAAATAAASTEGNAATDAEEVPVAAESVSGTDAAARLRALLSREIDAATGGGGRGPVPFGKWLTDDLVFAAHGLSGEVTRRGADLVGLPETTYRRRLRKAFDRSAAGQGARPPGWGEVQELLEEAIRASGGRNRDVCGWAEACLLEEVASRFSDDPRTAAALVGVTEPTLLRRLAAHRVVKLDRAS